MTGLLFEGIVASGKTSIVRELARHERWRRRESTLVLSSLFTERAVEHLRAQSFETYRTLMRQNLRILEAVRHVEMSSPLIAPGSGRDLCWMMERFHLSNAILHAEGDFDVFREIDQMLANFGCRLVLLTFADNAIEGRIDEAFRRRGAQWQIYHKRLEDRVGDVAGHFAEMQKRFVEGASWSTLPSLRVDTTDRDWVRCVNEIMEFWKI
jgi:hypothetical protein